MLQNKIIFLCLSLSIAILYLFPRYRLVLTLPMQQRSQLFLLKLQHVQPQRYNYVAFYLPSHKALVVKKVLGIPGDVLSLLDANTLEINSRKLNLQLYNHQGKMLHPLTSDQIVIPEKYYFVFSTENESYDSRYAEFGLIPSSKLAGIAVKIF